MVRSLGYAMLTSAWWVLPLEFLHGLTFGAMWAAGVQHTSNIAPRSLEATAQTVFAGLYNGAGSSPTALRLAVISHTSSYQGSAVS